MPRSFAVLPGSPSAVRLIGATAGLALVVLILLLGPAAPAEAATITVTTTADDATPSDGSVSLREAITAINAGNDLGDPDITAQAPGTFGTSDTINFNFVGAGVQTINVGTDPSAAGIPLPTIVKAVTINGYSEPGAAVNTLANGDNALILIELNGAGAGAGANGLSINGPSVLVKGLVINRFASSGIEIDALGSGATITGNFIGTNPAGTASSPNAAFGITVVDAPSVIIGGTTPGARNLLSGNTSGGISIPGSLATNALIQGNFVGTDAAGTAALANGIGIFLNNALTTTIGGTAAGARNVIAGNSGDGIEIGGPGITSAVVQGNFVGIGADGVAAVANGIGITVVLASGNTIGGTAAGAGNVIAFNAGKGIIISSGIGNTIEGNSIFSNGGLGIDLGNNGVTPNDPGDPDPGPNNLQNFPVLTSSTAGAGTLRVSGTLNSTPSTNGFRIELFSSSTCDPSGNGEGQLFIGFATVSTDASGNASFTLVGVPVPAGSVITATATDPGGNTSEFSACQTVGAPGVVVTPTAVNVTEGGASSSFTVRLTGVPTNVVTISLTFDASQVSLSPTTLTFQPDATAINPQTVTVTAVDNTVVDGTRTSPISFTASSADAAYNGIAITPVTATITDNDSPVNPVTPPAPGAPPSLSIAGTSVAEGDAGQSNASFVVTRNGPSAIDVVANYSFVNGTATGGPACTPGVDFVNTPGAVTVPSSQTNATILVSICGDVAIEGDETFSVVLSNPVNGTLAQASAQGTIIEGVTAPCRTTLTAVVPPGSKVLPVGGADGCAIGDRIVINPGGASQEVVTIVGFSSIVIDVPTRFNHLAGEVVVKLGAEAYVTPPEDDTDKKPKETENERHERDRTNASSPDDERIEGNVIAVSCDATWPDADLTIANRDGDVGIRLIKGSKKHCNLIQVGDYFDATGEKIHEQLFNAEDFGLRRGGRKVQ